MFAAWGLFDAFGILFGAVVFVPETYWSGVSDALPYVTVGLLGWFLTIAAVLGSRRTLA
ncbi:hypothetical protein SAMN05421872_11546 [Nocardioides lianchengensis]|uniref:Uncharacterized protein n=1 Tax=Nocardioides lianchengensis TaxID=1045774 RepID=A0A1G7AD35_9ACTN|nr:hypothetical protein [Nocardioides lianchengensis]SDE11935.1 hypothetical protein SAMN05421872_11546 [Nocardioides lianchengensis]